MLGRLKVNMTGACKAVWCHRAAYAGLALAYGAKCLGVIDADMLAQIVTALYCAMVGQRH